MSHETLGSKAFKPFATAAQDAISSFEAGIYWTNRQKFAGTFNAPRWQAALLAQEKSLAEAGDGWG